MGVETEASRRYGNRYSSVGCTRSPKPGPGRHGAPQGRSAQILPQQPFCFHSLPTSPYLGMSSPHPGEEGQKAKKHRGLQPAELVTHREWEAGARASCFLPVLDQQGLSDVAGILQLAVQVEAPRAERNASGCRTTKPPRLPCLWPGSGRRHFRAACGSFLVAPSPPLQQNGSGLAGSHFYLQMDRVWPTSIF